MQENDLLKYEDLVQNLAKYNKVFGYDKEDLEQEFRMILWKCLQNFKVEKKVKFETYFITACNNEIKRLRKKNKEKCLSLDNQVNENEDFIDLLLDNTFEKEQDIKELEHFLDNTPYGDYGKKYFIEKWKQNEIADYFNVSTVWVNLKIKEVLKKIRKDF
jgi:RNA polymerase sigma factor (sigma-70 family)